LDRQILDAIAAYYRLLHERGYGRKSLLGSRRAVESNIVFTSQIRAAMAARKAIGDPRRWCGEPIQPMTLGNMRENGVRGLFCDLPRLRPSHCGRRRRLAG
jgi:hypothetical protein